ncbi:methyltransferase family protein [Methanospirillum lacunae]|uniref:Isoprenylcysteine carboxylmethyltransferase family protein n=1 Tax=Methanospirillum lacunae TaxID=668570 RepID=A0A2V2N8C1_9EURY|nr:isoprenylcysteine carboxylmethyltransferase family protein [Methanospirillum lacunae]PWR72517.1 isoprenylcysteine carboxylmethyltransferase family protein [Methanospirillum lacunae]
MTDFLDNKRNANTKSIFSIIKILLFFNLPNGILLFLSAGTVYWAMGWLYILIFLITNSFISIYINSDLSNERIKKHTNSKKWDHYLLILIFLFGVIVWIIAGLDHRFGWSGNIPITIQVFSTLMVIFGNVLFTWGILSNNYFSTTVRIQSERGHLVISHGPYRFLRHPGYLGVCSYTIFQCFMLGSVWALVPAAVVVVAFVIRTYLEDETLQRELTGYKEYAKNVRYRLIPEMW